MFSQPVRQAGPTAYCGDECRRRRRRRLNREHQRRYAARKLLEASHDIARALEEPRHVANRLPVSIEELVEIQRAMKGHVRGDGTAERLSQKYGVTTRSIYRYCGYGTPTRVQVGRYTAWFVPRLTGGTPVQLTEWVGLRVQGSVEDVAS